jgi:hypothetical protein
MSEGEVQVQGGFTDPKFHILEDLVKIFWVTSSIIL